MEIVHSNGDVNVLLITAICIGSILGILILISIFTRMKRKEEEELESYYEDDVEEVKPLKKKKVVRRKKSNSVKNKANTTTTPKPKSKVIKAPVVKAQPRVQATKKTTKPNTKPKVTTKVKVTTPVTKKSPTKTPVAKIDPNKTVDVEVLEPPKKVDNAPVIEPEVISKTGKAKQNSVKIIKVGNVQVRETLKLNDGEKKMLESIMTSPNRGHIFQVFNGVNIMDFNIDNPSQLDHIEKQIARFSKPNGKYVIYVVWESDLKHRITLIQKLRYNPNVRYK